MRVSRAALLDADVPDDSPGRKTLIVEKRFISFLILSMLIMYSFQALNRRLNPPVPDPAAGVEAGAQPGTQAGAEGGASADGAAAGTSGETAGAGTSDTAKSDTNADANPQTESGAEAASPAADTVAPQWTTLGSLDPARPEKMLVWLNNRGAAIEYIALHDDRYSDLDDNHVANTDTHPLTSLARQYDSPAPGDFYVERFLLHDMTASCG